MKVTPYGIEVNYNDRLDLMKLEAVASVHNLVYTFSRAERLVVFMPKHKDTGLEAVMENVKDVISVTEGLYD